MKKLNISIKEELKALREKHLLRNLKVLESGCYAEVAIHGERFVNFCSNNYLGLNGHEDIKNAVVEATMRWGTSSGASRLIVGNLEIFEEAEERLAKFKGTETALIFPSGYQANLSVISTLVNDGDVILSDELNHASIIDGCRLSKAKVVVFKHNDLTHLEELLKSVSGRKKLIVVDSVFSMDGDFAPLKEIYELANRYDSWLLVDDAHGTGTIGDKGRGCLEHFGIYDDNVMVLGTGGKALGVAGAFLCCNNVVRQYLINRCRGFIYSTAPMPAIPAGLMAAISVIQKEPWRVEKLKLLSSYFWKRLREKGLKTSKSPSHIIPFIVGDNKRAINFEEKLYNNGYFARAVRPPTVPEGTARIRFTLTSQHEIQHIDKVVEILSHVDDFSFNKSI